jgi:hypothetical protein
VGSAPHTERSERPGRGHPRLADAIDDGSRRALAKPVEEGIQAITRTLCDAADRALRGVGDPSVESKIHGLMEHEVPKPHALNTPADGRVETNGRFVVGHGGRIKQL